MDAPLATETSSCNSTDDGPCKTDLDQNFCCMGMHTTRNEEFQKALTDDRTYAVADQSELSVGSGRQQMAPIEMAQVILLPPKVARWRSTRTRSISFAATSAENNEMDFMDSGPCKPDLEACCQNISALLASYASKNNSDGRYPVPTAGFIYGYMRVLYAQLKLEPECCVYSYIYIKRLQNCTGLKIGAGNWEKLLIVTLLLATKFVDDTTLTNKHFAFALNGLPLKTINRLEAVMLQALHWDIYVPISEYTTTYFELIQQPASPTTTSSWQVDADKIRDYFSVDPKQYHKYYHFIFHGLNLQHILPNESL